MDVASLRAVAALTCELDVARTLMSAAPKARLGALGGISFRLSRRATLARASYTGNTIRQPSVAGAGHHFDRKCRAAAQRQAEACPTVTHLSIRLVTCRGQDSATDSPYGRGSEACARDIKRVSHRG